MWMLSWDILVERKISRKNASRKNNPVMIVFLWLHLYRNIIFCSTVVWSDPFNIRYLPTLQTILEFRLNYISDKTRILFNLTLQIFRATLYKQTSVERLWSRRHLKITNTNNSQYTKYFTTQKILLQVRKINLLDCWRKSVEKNVNNSYFFLSTFWQLTGISIMEICKSKQGLEPQCIILGPCELNLERNKYLYMIPKTSGMKQITMKLAKIQLCINLKTGR